MHIYTYKYHIHIIYTKRQRGILNSEIVLDRSCTEIIPQKSLIRVHLTASFVLISLFKTGIFIRPHLTTAFVLKTLRRTSLY